MPDQVYLNLWLESFDEDSMLDAWGKVLAAFPDSMVEPGVRGMAILPFSWAEGAVLEQVYAEGATIESIIEAAREFLHSDYAYQAAMRWDMWRRKSLEELAETDMEGMIDAEYEDVSSAEAAGREEVGRGASAPTSIDETLGWKRVPREVNITCLGPAFDRNSEDAVSPHFYPSDDPHFRLELGLDTLFLPDDASDLGDDDDWEEAALCYRDNIAQLLGLIHRLEKSVPLKRRLLWSAAEEDLSERIRKVYSES